MLSIVFVLLLITTVLLQSYHAKLPSELKEEYEKLQHKDEHLLHSANKGIVTVIAPIVLLL